jgi:hypothetical protein
MKDGCEKVSQVYEQAIEDYHIHNSIDSQIRNPYQREELDHLFYDKCWIDTVQWHLEDEIRHPDIDCAGALKMKRRIDWLNQERTNKVELIDEFFLLRYNKVRAMPGARLNSESPAWALDRLSILNLKIYHMKLEAIRRNASREHMNRCGEKLEILQEQHMDLCHSINELLWDIAEGYKYMKVYRQLKMYNDPNLNPALYNSVKV